VFGNFYLLHARRFDDKTGLHYFRNRYYEARMGRFIGRDPLLYHDGMNLYFALMNDPGGWRDPLGESIVLPNDTGRSEIRRDLCEICPCFDIDIERATGLVRAARPGPGPASSSCQKLLREAKGRKPLKPGESFADCYCRHRAGCNLLLDLTGGSAETVIETTGAEDEERGNQHDSGRVKYNPDKSRSEGEYRPPSVGLAHELIHAHHYHTGTRHPDKTPREHRTVRAENQIRAEMRGDAIKGGPRYKRLAPRTTYNGIAVGNPEAGDLDVTDRFGCCDFEVQGAGGLKGWHRAGAGGWVPY
jgi:RHS repeat-associated protein